MRRRRWGACCQDLSTYTAYRSRCQHPECSGIDAVLAFTYRRAEICLDSHEVETMVAEQHLHDLAGHA